MQRLFEKYSNKFAYVRKKYYLCTLKQNALNLENYV